jgi:energy-coupling factor transport system permease protein
LIKVPVGIYVPGSSWIHQLDPRGKLLIILLLSILLFSVNVPLMLAAVMGMVLLGFIIARIPLRSTRSLVNTVLFISTFTFVANAIAWGGMEADFHLVGIGISTTGVLRGVFFMTRLLTLVFATSLLTLTTSPVSMTDAITSILSPLRVFRVPVDDIALVFSIALRFIPTIADEADKIVIAQTARGAQFANGNLFARIKAWVPVLIPLLVQLFRRADNLALAMESRCYTGQGRTRLRELKWHARDSVATGIVVALCITVWSLALLGMI